MNTYQLAANLSQQLGSGIVVEIAEDANPVLVETVAQFVLEQFKECASDNCHRPAEKRCEWCGRDFCKDEVSFAPAMELHVCEDCGGDL